MCQRYVVPEQRAAEREFLPAKAWWKFVPKFNVSVGHYVPAIRQHERENEGVMLRWGLIPASWEAETGYPVETAGLENSMVAVEALDRADAFHHAWRAGQRCILPFAGYYIWRRAAAGHRQPMFVSLTRAVFGVAALWERWTQEEDVIESCSIVGVSANQISRDDGDSKGLMPAILRRKDYGSWLVGTLAEARKTLAPYPEVWMHALPVSPRVNVPTVDDPGLIRAVS